MEERFGVGPERVVEIMGLMGDASDNIPGVPGHRRKNGPGADQRVRTIENVLAHVQEITKPKLRQSLIENAHLARLSRELARLCTMISLSISIYDMLSRKEPDNSALLALLRELEFSSLLKYVTPEPEQEKKLRARARRKGLSSKLLDAPVVLAGEFSFDTETMPLDPHQSRTRRVLVFCPAP